MVLVRAVVVARVVGGAIWADLNQKLMAFDRAFHALLELIVVPLLVSIPLWTGLG